jgi:hypothetical protein
MNSLLILFFVVLSIAVLYGLYQNFKVEEVEEVEEKEEQNADLPNNSWCFVGEDLSGRYCVKVPSEESCEAYRLFKSRDECELVTASHMPAGITHNGADFLPVANMNILDN